MNILFITLSKISSLNEKSIYTDLLSEFRENGHNISVVSPIERRYKASTDVLYQENADILRVKIGNITKTNIIEKGISTLLVEYQFKMAIKKYFNDRKFDLVMYSTPPITFANVIKYVKKRDGAQSYLLLKDIFPQNAVDIGMFGKKSLFNMFFRKKEKALYKLSDKIGCMSQANVDYILDHNAYINKDIVHISPNTITPITLQKNDKNIELIKQKFTIPTSVKVFIYGGNLGKPQGIPYLIDCLKSNINKDDRFFIISGTGTEYWKIKEFVDEYQPINILLINGLPKDEYNELVAACDVGLIFLDNRFTIPNFPSRLLAYMQNGMPVIACTDKNTDIGKVIVDGGFGWWCESIDVSDFTTIIDEVIIADIEKMGNVAKDYLMENYTAKQSYEIIMREVCDDIERV